MQFPALHPCLLSILLGVLSLGVSCSSGPSGQNGPLNEAADTNQAALLVSYNLENLFDTQDDPDNPGDNEFLPGAAKNWTSERYAKKLKLLSEALQSLAAERQHPLSLIAVQEVENQAVVLDLARQLESRQLGAFAVAHRPSPDERGIDNALIYNRNHWKLSNMESVTYTLPDPGDQTRSTLLATLTDLQDTSNTLIVGVNHWPSRGSDSTYRIAVANQLNEAFLEVYLEPGDPGPMPAAVLVGDFNDEPFNASITEALGAEAYSSASQARWLNLTSPLVSDTIGTYFWGGDSVWNLLDQVIASRYALDPTGVRLLPGSIGIYAPENLREQKPGKYFRSPLNTYGGRRYLGGPSDHFPLVVELTGLGALPKANAAVEAGE